MFQIATPADEKGAGAFAKKVRGIPFIHLLPTSRFALPTTHFANQIVGAWVSGFFFLVLFGWPSN
jgi:hypothetical protein